MVVCHKSVRMRDDTAHAPRNRALLFSQGQAITIFGIAIGIAYVPTTARGTVAYNSCNVTNHRISPHMCAHASQEGPPHVTQ